MMNKNQKERNRIRKEKYANARKVGFTPSQSAKLKDSSMIRYHIAMELKKSQNNVMGIAMGWDNE